MLKHLRSVLAFLVSFCLLLCIFHTVPWLPGGTGRQTGFAMWPSAVYAAGNDVVIEDADTVWGKGLLGSEALDLLAQQVSARVLLEYADSGFGECLGEPYGVKEMAASVSSRPLVEYADSTFGQALLENWELTHDAGAVCPRILAEYADSILGKELLEGADLNLRAAVVPSRVLVEYADSIMTFELREEEPVEEPLHFNYPLSTPWTDTLGFGESWGSYYGHLGEDYSAPAGTPVYCVASGEVVLRHNDPYVGEMKGWGNALIIRHDMPGGEVIYSQYAHFASMLVNVGDAIELGQEIGTIGQTGLATGPHLHLEIKSTPQLGPGYAGYSFTGDMWTHGGITYYRASTFIEQHRGFQAGDMLAVTGTGGVGLRLRSSPLINPDNILAVMPEGSQVTVTSGPTIAHGYGWWRVQFVGQQGWAAGRYLSRTEGQAAPSIPLGLGQYTVDGTSVWLGGMVQDSHIVLKGTVTSPGGGPVKLQVEVRREGEGFTRPTHESIFVLTGEEASVTVGDLAEGGYHWRARAVTASGMTSEWKYFSEGPEADFIVVGRLWASFSFYPLYPVPGEDVEFDASASFPSGGIVLHVWDFDDGQIATGKVVQHQFSETGTYDVRLTVESDDGQTCYVIHQVSVVSKDILEAVNTFVDDAIAHLDKTVDVAEELAAAADYFKPSEEDMTDLSVRLWTRVLVSIPIPDIPKIIKLVIPAIYEYEMELFDYITDRLYEGEDYQSILVDPFSDIVEDYKTEILLLRDEVLTEIASLPPEQINALLNDLRSRDPGNEYIEQYLESSSRFPLDMKEMREYNEQDWAYQRAKNIFNVLVGTAAVLGSFLIPGGFIGVAVYGGVVGLGHIVGGTHEFLAQLDQDGQLSAAAAGDVINAMVQAETIFRNTKDGLCNIQWTADGASPASVPGGRMASIEHIKEHAIEQSFGFFDVNWWVREAYSEVVIENNSADGKESDYWLYVAIDRRIPSDKWLYVIPARYFDTLFVLEDEIESLPAGSLSDPVRFTYLDREEGGFIPEEEDGLFFVLMARRTGDAIYVKHSRVSTFGTTLITSDGEAIAQEDLEGVPTYQYPIRSQVDATSVPAEYTLAIFICNPTESPLMAELSQPLPAQGKVVSTDGGVIGADSITWELRLGASAAEVLEVKFTEVTDNPFEMPAAQYEMYDIINDSWVGFDSDPLVIEIPMTVSTTELPDGEVGLVYEATLEAFGGVPPYSWNWTAQEEGQCLPPGLNLAAETGVISGIPTEGGIFEFTVQVTDAGNFTASSDLSITFVEIEEIHLSLQAGWNMVSVPVTPADNSTSALFPGVAGIFAWNATSRSYYVPSVIDPEKGYWVAVTENTTITIDGTPIETWTTDIKAGWNMIGSVSRTASIVSPNDSPDGSVIPTAYWWDPDSKGYILTTDIEPGKGYWLASLNDCTLRL